MKRTGFYLTEQELEILNLIMSKTGLTMSDIVRRAIDKYIEEFKAKLDNEDK